MPGRGMRKQNARQKARWDQRKLAVYLGATASARFSPYRRRGMYLRSWRRRLIAIAILTLLIGLLGVWHELG